MASKPYPLTAINGGINLLRPKGSADPKALYDLQNGYVTQAGTIKVREGTFRNADIALYSGVGTTKGLVAYQSKLHVFSNRVVDVPPDYELHVLTHPGANQLNSPGVGGDPDWGLVSLLLPLSAIPFVDTSPSGRAFSNSGVTLVPDGPSGPGAGSARFTNGPGGGGQQLLTPMIAGDNIDLNNGDDYTVEGWFKQISGGPSGTQILWSTLNTSGSGDVFTRGYLNNGVPTLQSAFPNVTAVSGAATTAVWTHLAWVYDSVAQVGRVYTNGVQGTSAGQGSAPGSYTDNGFSLGADALSSVQGTGYNGQTADFRVTRAVRYTANFTPSTAPFPGSPSYGPIVEIHFAQPFLGGLYVVAEFDVNSEIAATLGTVFHFWIQSSEGGDNANAWQKNTDFRIGDVVIPTVPNGLTYIAARRGAANPIWTPSTPKEVGDKVEPTLPNGFFYTATAVAGDNPTTSTSEPVWPAADGASVQENSALANDQTVTLATAAPNAPVPTVPPKYGGTIAGGFAG